MELYDSFLYVPCNCEKAEVPQLLSGKESACNVGDNCSFDPWIRKIPWRRKWQPAPVPGESHGQRSLVGYSPWSCKESDMMSDRGYMHKYNSVYVLIPVS